MKLGEKHKCGLKFMMKPKKFLYGSGIGPFIKGFMGSGHNDQVTVTS